MQSVRRHLIAVYFYGMKIQFWSVGKPHDVELKDAIQSFTARIGKYSAAEWKLIAPVKNAASLSETELKKKEADQILSLLSANDFLVLLDERGKIISSPELATLIQQRANESTRNLIFLIGGAFGVDETVKQRANFTWSFSKLVFPHMIVRLVLAEQVYRAFTILKNEKYHHA